jgi:hypothetical protein
MRGDWPAAISFSHLRRGSSLGVAMGLACRAGVSVGSIVGATPTGSLSSALGQVLRAEHLLYDCLMFRGAGYAHFPTAPT